MLDLIIIGAGPAGLSAAIYAVRKKLNVLVLGDEFGGQSAQAHMVQNYLGLPDIVGSDLAQAFLKHAKSLGVEIKKDVVKNLERKDNGFILVGSGGSHQTRAVIVASGKQYRRLDITGAAEFEGKGISYCATCDAPLFRNKNVAVVGAGDAGQDATWELTKYAKKVYLFNRYPELRGDDIVLQEQLKKSDQVEIFNASEPLEIKGDKFVKSLVFRHNGSEEKKEVELEGIFVEIGSTPVAGFLKNLVNFNEKGEIIIDPKTNQSSQPGIFAAGDVTDVPHKQMIVAAGEGAKAALAAYEYLKNN